MAETIARHFVSRQVDFNRREIIGSLVIMVEYDAINARLMPLIAGTMFAQGKGALNTEFGLQGLDNN